MEIVNLFKHIIWRLEVNMLGYSGDLGIRENYITELQMKGVNKMKPAVIDRGVYKLGRRNADKGKTTEPHWVSDREGNSLIIGHKDEPFEISHIGDIKFILTELSKRLGLDLISKAVKKEFNNEEYLVCLRCGEVFENQELFSGDSKIKFCSNCGAVLDCDDAEVEEE